MEQAIARSSAAFLRQLAEALAGRGLASGRSALDQLLADLPAVRPAAAAAWASGRAAPTVDRALDLARASGVDLDTLLAGLGAPFHDPETAELLRLFRRLPADRRTFVLQAARVAAGEPPTPGPDRGAGPRRTPRARSGRAARKG